MEFGDYLAFTLAGIGAFLIFLGGWSTFTSLSVFSELGLSMGWMIEGIPLLAVGVSIGLLVVGFVCAYGAYWYCSAEAWPVVRAVFVFLLIGLLVAQVVYAWSEGRLPSSDGVPTVPGQPSLSGSYQLFCDGVAVSSNVPFDVWYNGARLGQDARFTINADLTLKNAQGAQLSPLEFRVGLAYAPKTSSGFPAYTVYPLPVREVYASWTGSGRDLKESVRDLQILTIGATDYLFFGGTDGECRFKFTVYACCYVNGNSVATGARSVEFVLRSTMGSLRIERVSGWAE